MNSGPEKKSLASRAYRALLKLFPFDFRGDFGEEMEEVFHEQRADAQKSKGKFGLLRLWWETVLDIFRTAPREHAAMLRQDGGYAIRMMRKNPAFTIAAVLTIALGIGANTAIFSVVYGVLLKPLPYGNGDELVHLKQVASRVAPQGNFPFSEKEKLDFEAQTKTLSGVAEYHSMAFILIGDEPQRVQTGVVSPHFFDLFQIRPILGRGFTAEDDKHGAGEGVLMLTYRFWQRSFNGDRSIINRKFQMNNRPHIVIGVLPPLPGYPDENDVYMPVSHCPFRSAQQTRENRNGRMVNLYARLKPGATLEQARAEAATIASRLEKEYPQSYPANLGYTASADEVRRELTQDARLTFTVLLGTAGFVLLIACANVANLALARVLRREREIGIRAAMGASRTRLVRQLLTESAILSLLGGALGLAIAWSGQSMLVQFASRFTPRADEITMDATVLLFTLGVSLLSGLIFGALPALSSAENVSAALREGGRTTGSVGRHRARGVLLVSQVAFSFVLLIGAGLMMRSLVKLLQVNPGFSTENVLAARVALNFTKYNTPDLSRAFFRTLQEKLEGQPGIVSVGITSNYPMMPGAQPGNQRVLLEGQTAADPDIRTADPRVASPGYFRTIGMPLVSGRWFTPQDQPDSPPVAIVNQAFAQKFFPGEDAVGKRISTNLGNAWMEIVGVVADVRHYGPGQAVAAEVYRPLEQIGFSNRVLLRSSGSAIAMAEVLRRVVREIDPHQPVEQFRTLEQARSDSIANPRLTASLMGLFAGLALLITITGIAGVMVLSVNQRTHEIGIRMALGASPGKVLRMVMGQGLLLVIAGLAIGVFGALWLTKLMTQLLFAVEPTDVVTFVGVSAVLLLCAAIACWLPARRAATIDPMIALRTE